MCGKSGGHAWQGVCMAGGHAWQGSGVWWGWGMRDRTRPLQQTVRILLKCILVRSIISFGVCYHCYQTMLSKMMTVCL